MSGLDEHRLQELPGECLGQGKDGDPSGEPQPAGRSKGAAEGC